MPDKEEDRIQHLIALRNKRLKLKDTPKSAIEAIRRYMNPEFEDIILTEEQEQILKRWKSIFNWKLEGKTDQEIMSLLKKIFGISDITVRWDLSSYHQVLPVSFDGDLHMYLIYQRNEKIVNKYEAVNDPKYANIAIKALKEMKEIALYFAQKPRPLSNDIIGPVIITLNPKDVGIDDDLPTLEALKERYKSRRRNDLIEEAHEA